MRTLARYIRSGRSAGRETNKARARRANGRDFDGPTQIAPGITATIHPGHTPGSVFYTVESEGETIVFVGDIVHIAAVQFPDPTITITYDVDLNGAAATRRKAFADFARKRTLIAIPHISFPGLGHVRVAGSGFDWVPVDYGNRTT
jgi:glyoxylase-like metal-dependent hydrolase (beta-lactamase superfamily II)